VLCPRLTARVVLQPYGQAVTGRAFRVFGDSCPAGLSKKVLVNPGDVFCHGCAEVGDVYLGELDCCYRELASAKALDQGFPEGSVGTRLVVVYVAIGLSDGLAGSVNEIRDAVLDRGNLVVPVPCFLWRQPCALAIWS